MSQKSLIALAGTLTAFVLVLVGGVAGRVSSAQAAAAAAPAVTPSPAVAELWNQREAAYRSLIDQANQRLLAANAQTAAAAADIGAGAAGIGQAATNITPEQAAVLALVASRGASLTALPELVNFQGTVAFEAKMTSGLIYIDAASGRVLYNGAARQMVVAGVSGEPGEHESGDD